jgi:hypothetical protein
MAVLAATVAAFAFALGIAVGILWVRYWPLPWPLPPNNHLVWIAEWQDDSHGNRYRCEGTTFVLQSADGQQDRLPNHTVCTP